MKRYRLLCVWLIFALGTPAFADYTLTTLFTLDDSGASGLTFDSAGNLYGTIYNNGANTSTIFEVAKGTQALTPLVTFGDTNGNYPEGGLISDSSGNLFGMTSGEYSTYGSVFEVAAGTHALGTVVRFDGTDGEYADGTLTSDAAGNLYGTTNGDGNQNGTVFQVAAGTHALTTLIKFSGSTEQPLSSGVIADAAGDVYGVTQNGGANGQGTVFEISASTHAFATLDTFDYPTGGLTSDAAGNLYGTATGGSNGEGIRVFEVAEGTHALSTLATYNINLNNAEPPGPDTSLISDAAGNLFGIALYGGANNLGSLFEIAAGTHTLSTLVTFNIDNAYPQLGLALDAAGDLYGATGAGGVNGGGTIFELSLNQWSRSNGSSWNVGSNWSSGIPDGQGAQAVFGSALLMSDTVTLDGNRTVGQITFNNSTANYTIAPGNGGSLTVDNSTGAGGVNSASICVIAGNHSITAPITLVSGVSVVTAQNTSLVVSGTISGSGGITVYGSGALTLSGANTYSGGTGINAGTLVVSNSTGSATGADNVTLNGGTLASGTTGNITGTVVAGSGPHVIAPGLGLPAGTFGNLSVGGLVTNSNTTLQFALASPVAGATSVGSTLTIGSGGLTVGAGTSLAFVGANSNPIFNGLGDLATGNYRLMGGNVGGGNLNNVIIPSHSPAETLALTTTADPGFIDLAVRIATSALPTLPTITVPQSLGSLMLFDGSQFDPAPISLHANNDTYVITHGWRDDDTSWVTSMAVHIHTEDPSATILAWNWPAVAASPYAGGQVGFEGQLLGQQLNQTLSLGNSAPSNFHFIGHSLGTFVDKQAIDYLDGPGLHLGLTPDVTILDAPAVWGDTIFPAVPSGLDDPMPDAGNYRNVDNYISAFGSLQPGGVENVILQHSPLESASDFHDYAYEFYDGTITPGASNVGFGKVPTAFSFYQQQSRPSLDVTSISADAASKATPSVIGRSTWLTLDFLKGLVGIFGNAVVNAIPTDTGPVYQTTPQVIFSGHASSAVSFPLLIPADAQGLSFSSLFHDVPAGDTLNVSINGQTIWSLDGQFATDDSMDQSGVIDVSAWAGQNVDMLFEVAASTPPMFGLTVSLDDASATDEQITLDQIMFQSVPEPTSLALLGAGFVGLLAHHRRREL